MSKNPVFPNESGLAERFEYHRPPNDLVINRHETIRDTLSDAAHQLGSLMPPSRERSLFYTKMEEAMMWGNAAIARNHEHITPCLEDD